MRKLLLLPLLFALTGCSAKKPVVYQDLFLILNGVNSATVKTTEPTVQDGFLHAQTIAGAEMYLSAEFLLMAIWGDHTIELRPTIDFNKGN